MFRKIFVIVPLVYLLVLLFQVDLGMIEDLGRHLKMGEIVWMTHEVPTTNLFSWRAGDFPIVNHEWLTQVLFYIVFNSFGFTGLLLLKFLLVIGAFGIVYFLALKKYPILWVWVIGIFCIAVFATRFRVRPELISYLFISIYYYIFEKFGETKKYKMLVLLPVIMAFWVNMHIFFAIGLFMIAAFILEDWIKNKKTDKKLFLVGVVSGFATLINPAGIHGALLPLTIFHNYNFIVEENYSPFEIFNTTSGFVYTLLMQVYLFEILAVTTIIGSLFILKKRNIVYPLNGIFNAILGLKMVRNISLLGIAGFIPLVHIFSSLEKKLNNNFHKKLLRYSALSLVIIFVFYHLRGLYGNDIFSFSFRTYAEDGGKFFAEHKIEGPIFNNYMIGNHLIFWLYPQNQIYVDARPEAYPGDFFDEYNRMFVDYPFFDQQAEKYEINAVVMGVQDDPNVIRPFMLHLIQSPNWIAVYADGRVTILLKNNEKNKKIIDTFKINPQ